MKKWLAASAAFFSVYLCFVIAFLPANFVISKLTLPNNITLGQASGSIWHAKVDSALIEKTLFNNIDINFNWLSILSFSPKVNVSFGGALYQGPEGKFVASNFLSDLKIIDLQLDISADEIAQQLPLPIPVTAKSTVTIAVSEFVMGQPVCQQLSGTIHWKDAAIVALSEQVPLGTLSAALSCENGQGVAQLDEKNDLGVTFTATLAARGQISGNGYITPHQQLPKAIEQILPFLGRKDPEGRYYLAF